MTRVAVERREVSAQIRKIEESINRAKQVIRWNVLFEVEGIKQPVLVAAVSSHHAAAFSLSGLVLRPHKRKHVQCFSTK